MRNRVKKNKEKLYNMLRQRKLRQKLGMPPKCECGRIPNIIDLVQYYEDRKVNCKCDLDTKIKYEEDTLEQQLAEVRCECGETEIACVNCLQAGRITQCSKCDDKST